MADHLFESVQLIDPGRELVVYLEEGSNIAKLLDDRQIELLVYGHFLDAIHLHNLGLEVVGDNLAQLVGDAVASEL